MSAIVSSPEGNRIFAPPASNHAAPIVLHELLASIVERLEPGAAADAVRHVFSTLARLIEDLRGVEIEVTRGDSLEKPRAVFSSAESKALDLVSFIEADALATEGVSEELAEAFVALSFCISHEIRKVFEVEFVGMDFGQPEAQMRGELARASGLLCNCFQQSSVILAQVFDPTVDGQNLFNDVRSRHEQSLVLCDDLSSLVEFVRGRTKQSHPQSMLSLLDRVEAFRGGSLRYLMRKDWEAFDGFVDEIVSARGAQEFASEVKKFQTYLETLLGHVQMRAALKGQPADVYQGEAQSPLFQHVGRRTGGRTFLFSVAVSAGLALACLIAFFGFLSQGRSPVRASALAVNTPSSLTSATPEREAPAVPSNAPSADTSEVFTVQLGAYGVAGQAAGRVAQLKSKGIEAQVSQAYLPNRGSVYRVRAGRFDTRDEAAHFVAELRRRGVAQEFIVTKSNP